MAAASAAALSDSTLDQVHVGAGRAGSPVDIESCPYVGPRPFEWKDQSLFFGRAREAATLVSLIVAHPVVLLYAPSGAGKTSLLNADVTPRLEARGFQVLGGVRVNGEAGQGAPEAANIYAFNALMSLDAAGADPARLARASLAEYLRSRARPAPEHGSSPLRVLVFDQFEELFTTFGERWNERAAFFDQLAEALEEDRHLRVVLAMREEFIASLDPHAGRLPERLRTRFRLERLGHDAALAAITGPLEGTGRRFQPAAAEKLVASLLKVAVRSANGTMEVSADSVEPLHLQLVCTKIWNALPRDATEIDEGSIEELGDIDDALGAYFEHCVALIVAASGVPEGKVRGWFERALVTAERTRGIVARGAESTGGLPNAVVEQAERMWLVRREMRGVNAWYELAHDRFVTPILRANERWRARHGVSALEALELEARARRYVASGKRKTELLSRVELRHAMQWLDAPETAAFGVSEEVREFVQASQMRERLRRIVLGAIGAGGVAVLGAAVVGFAFYQGKVNAEDEMLDAYGEIAKRLAGEPRKAFDALLFGMRAVEPRLGKRRAPPPLAIAGLRSALEALGDNVWLRGFRGEVSDVAISPDGRLALARTTEQLCAWDASSGKRSYCLDLRKNDAQPDVFFSSDRKWIYRPAPEGSRSDARVWEADSGKRVMRKELDGMSGFAMSANGAWAATYARDGAVRVLNMQKGAAGRSFAIPGILRLVVAPTGALVAAVTRNGDVEVWTRNGEKLYASQGARSYDAAFSPDGARIAISSLNDRGRLAQILLRPAAERDAIWTALPVELGERAFFTVRFADDGRSLVALTGDAATTFDRVTQRVQNRYAIAENSDSMLREDGRLVMRDPDGTRIAVVEPRSGAELHRFVLGEPVRAYDFSTDYERLVAAGANLLKVYPASARAASLDAASAAELFAAACAKLLPQPEAQSVQAASAPPADEAALPRPGAPNGTLADAAGVEPPDPAVRIIVTRCTALRP